MVDDGNPSFELSYENATQPLAGGAYDYTYNEPFLNDARQTPTQNALVGQNTSFARFTLLQRDPDTDTLQPLAVNADLTAVLEPYGVAAVTAATGAGETTSAAVWVGGTFNHERLIWPALLDTYAKRRAFVRKYFNPAIFDIGEVKNGALAY